MNRFKRIIAVIVIAVILLVAFIPAVTEPVFADTNKWKEEDTILINPLPDKEGSEFVPIGGVNSFNYITAESKAETQELEKYLRDHDYVLVNTAKKEITDKEADICKNLDTANAKYMSEDNSFEYDENNYKVYEYKPLLEYAVKEYEETGILNDTLKQEMSLSSVRLDYYAWYTKDRIGQVMETEEINENLPERYEENAGFIEFLSPINAEIVLHLIDNDYYYRIYIAKGETLVKVRSEHYEITSVNAVDTYYNEELLTNNNYFVVWQNPEYDPIVVNLTELVKRDKIPDRNIEGKPDCAWVWKNVEIKDFDDIIVEGKDEDEKSLSWGWIVMILTLLGMGAGVYVYVKRSR